MLNPFQYFIDRFILGCRRELSVVERAVLKAWEDTLGCEDRVTLRQQVQSIRKIEVGLDGKMRIFDLPDDAKRFERMDRDYLAAQFRLRNPKTGEESKATVSCHRGLLHDMAFARYDPDGFEVVGLLRVNPMSVVPD